MVKIFGRTVEKPEIERKILKLSSSDFQKLPTGEFEVRDNQGNKWKCQCKPAAGVDYCLYVERWDDFVKTLGIKAGRSTISLHKEDDSFSPGATPYKFEVENR